MPHFQAFLINVLEGVDLGEVHCFQRLNGGKKLFIPH